MNKILIIFLTSVLFVSCKQIEVGKMQAFNVKEFSGRTISVDIQFEVNNERMLPVTIKQSEFQILVGEKELGIATLQQEVTLKQKTLGIYYFPVSLKLSDNIGSYFSILKIMRKSEGRIILKGWMDTKSGPFRKKINFEKEIRKEEIPFL